MKTICTLFFFNLFYFDCKSQVDSAKPIDTRIGMYLKKKDFKLHKPAKSGYFKMIKHDSLVDAIYIDTLKHQYYCMTTDSTVYSKSALAIFDGKHLYIINGRRMDTTFFIRSPYIGMFPYAKIMYKNEMYVFSDLLTLAVVITDAIISKPRKTIVYMNKRGKWMIATPQSVWYLIRKEADLKKAFFSEGKVDVQILEKYIIEMNKRYPL